MLDTGASGGGGSSSPGSSGGGTLYSKTAIYFTGAYSQVTSLVDKPGMVKIASDVPAVPNIRQRLNDVNKIMVIR